MTDGFCIIKEDDIVHVVPVGKCPGGGGGVVDGQILYDDNHVESLDAGERYVKDAAGNTHIDWSDPSFTAYHRPIYIYGNGNGTLDPPDDYALVLKPSSIDLIYYPLGGVETGRFSVMALANSGFTLNAGLLDGGGALIANPRIIRWATNRVEFFPDATNQPYFFLRDDTHAELYLDDIRNYSDDENPNIDLLHRKLYAADGTTQVIDYSSGKAVVVFPDSDPHVAGAAYWVAGVLTKSAG